jgi:hypothetical protein
MRLLPLSLLLLVAACSSYTLKEPRTPPVAAFGPARTDVATVCVIRPSHYALGVTFVVHDNGQLVGATRGESYFCYEAEPGDHRITSGTGDAFDKRGGANLTAQAGGRYWLHQDYANVFGVIVDKLEWVDEDRARELIADCDYKVVAGVPGSEELPRSVPLAKADPPDSKPAQPAPEAASSASAWPAAPAPPPTLAAPPPAADDAHGWWQ